LIIDFWPEFAITIHPRWPIKSSKDADCRLVYFKRQHWLNFTWTFFGPLWRHQIFLDLSYSHDVTPKKDQTRKYTDFLKSKLRGFLLV